MSLAPALHNTVYMKQLVCIICHYVSCQPSRSTSSWHIVRRSPWQVWEAMRTLKNGKAGCPTDGLVNELLKYGGMTLAGMLAP